MHFPTITAFATIHSRNLQICKNDQSYSEKKLTTLKEHVEKSDDTLIVDMNLQQRRTFLYKVAASSARLSALSFANNLVVRKSAWAKPSEIDALLGQLKEARAQLEPVPNLIKEEKWDAVRAILITPPLADCWAKTSKPLLKLYAQAQDDLPSGDELAALELREEALDHLRFLDMAVYNNVFNPIKSEGETGATKELIRSYYEDPINEYKQCVRILDDLITLSK